MTASLPSRRTFTRGLTPPALLLSALLGAAPALAQTAPAQTTPAPATPAQTTPAPTAAPTAPVAPAAQPASKTAVNTGRLASAVAVEISSAVKGQLVRCPATLKLSASAVCLYVKSPSATLRPVIRGKLGARVPADWKTSGKASALLVTDSPGGPVGAFVLLSGLSDTDSLVAVDAVQAKAAASAAPVATPAGVVKGQPYVLGSDLVGVVNVTSMGSGKYRLSTEGAAAGAAGGSLTVTVGQKTAQAVAGTVELPLVPATDGKNLIFPLAGLRALGCTVTPAGANLTVACGSASVGLKPIVF